MKTILFQGDSITDAGRSREDENMLGSGYAMLAKASLDYNFPGEYRSLNRGISGNRIVDLYARMKSDIINLAPDYLSLLVGINDVLHEVLSHNGIDADEFYTVYDMMVQRIKAALPDTKIMILEPFTLYGTETAKDWTYFQKEVPQRAAAAKKVADKHSLLYVPLQKRFDEATKIMAAEYWLRDGIHPTAAGAELLKNEWLNAFNEMKKG